MGLRVIKFCLNMALTHIRKQLLINISEWLRDYYHEKWKKTRRQLPLHHFDDYYPLVKFSGIEIALPLLETRV